MFLLEGTQSKQGLGLMIFDGVCMRKLSHQGHPKAVERPGAGAVVDVPVFSQKSHAW